MVRNVGLCVAMQVKVKGGRRSELENMEEECERSRARQNPASMEDSRDGDHCSRCGGRSHGSSNQEHAFSKPLQEEPDEQGGI